MQPQALAFDANDFKDAVIDCAKQANAPIYVNRPGDAYNPEASQKALDSGANSIQTNLPAERINYLHTHNLATR
jgi:glycerophosphoryl diester phosphodiesterase